MLINRFDKSIIKIGVGVTIIQCPVSILNGSLVDQSLYRIDMRENGIRIDDIPCNGIKEKFVLFKKCRDGE